GAPEVAAYWLTWALIAAHAASLIACGAGKSGNPCERLTPPYNSLSRVISRITDSVNCVAFLEPVNFDIIAAYDTRGYAAFLRRAVDFFFAGAALFFFAFGAAVVAALALAFFAAGVVSCATAGFTSLAAAASGEASDPQRRRGPPAGPGSASRAHWVAGTGSR